MPSENVRGAVAGTQVAHVPLTLPEIDNTLDLKGFADTMSGMAATVIVATAASVTERHARTVTAVTSLTSSPPSLVVSIAKGSDLARLMEETGRFSLSLLAEGQEEVGDACAGKLGLDDRFSVGEWTAWPSGQPRLEGAATLIDCQVAGMVSVGNRTMFIGVLTNARTSTLRPLLWYDRDYHQLAES